MESESTRPAQTLELVFNEATQLDVVAPAPDSASTRSLYTLISNAFDEPTPVVTLARVAEFRAACKRRDSDTESAIRRVLAEQRGLAASAEVVAPVIAQARAITSPQPTLVTRVCGSAPSRAVKIRRSDEGFDEVTSFYMRSAL